MQVPEDLFTLAVSTTQITLAQQAFLAAMQKVQKDLMIYTRDLQEDTSYSLNFINLPTAKDCM